MPSAYCARCFAPDLAAAAFRFGQSHQRVDYDEMLATDVVVCSLEYLLSQPYALRRLGQPAIKPGDIAVSESPILAPHACLMRFAAQTHALSTRYLMFSALVAVPQPRNHLHSVHWRRLVLDECHTAIKLGALSVLSP
jgi:SNF2 family DNA or RNA helicase